jgi:hypothetical protein
MKNGKYRQREANQERGYIYNEEKEYSNRQYNA